MRLILHLFGIEVLDLDITTSSDEPEPPPRTFGFHASGPGLIETADDTMLDTLDRRP